MRRLGRFLIHLWREGLDQVVYALLIFAGLMGVAVLMALFKWLAWLLFGLLALVVALCVAIIAWGVVGMFVRAWKRSGERPA
ncbi:MAG TPA: hypothetical protein VF167_02885 [Longimicrobiaceae bacterium]